jgi:hypothetical protein
MRLLNLRIGIWIAAAGLLILLVAAGATWVKQRQEFDTVCDVQKIARSLEIIRTSTPSNRKVLKVLFYGQSITRSGWDKIVIQHWQQTYPNTVFVVQNRALGGFASPALERTTEQDIAAFYPDLIIFHVYGDHRAYERIIRLMRSRTAADIIVQTDYGTTVPDPPCREGLQLALHRPPGCAGYGWLHQRDWYDEMSYHKIPAFAKKYALAMEPQRTWWRTYLLSTGVNPSLMVLPDNIHPNDKGKALMAVFFDSYFDNLVARWNGQSENNVVSIPSPVPTAGHETVDFDGSRLELLTAKPIANWPAVTIDGTPPNQYDGCYQVTRASSIKTVPDWPALRRINLRHDHVAEDWTLTLTRISPDQKSFSFSVEASITGNEGGGDSAHDFLSKSGRLSIERQDWMVEPAFELKHIPLQAPFAVNWSVNDVCDGSPEAIDRGEGSMEYRYVLGTGLVNERHRVTLSLSPGDLANVTEFRAYKPRLHEQL